jgi:hypothetical protein
MRAAILLHQNSIGILVKLKRSRASAAGRESIPSTRCPGGAPAVRRSSAGTLLAAGGLGLVPAGAPGPCCCGRCGSPYPVARAHAAERPAVRCQRPPAVRPGQEPRVAVDATGAAQTLPACGGRAGLQQTVPSRAPDWSSSVTTLADLRRRGTVCAPCLGAAPSRCVPRYFCNMGKATLHPDQQRVPPR